MTLKHLTVTVCILSLSFLLKSCNAEDIDSLNSQISELTEKLEIPELTQDNMPVLRTSSTIPVRLYPPDLFKRIRDS